MYTNIDEMYHAAIKILENRSEQLGDDELMHYGRKGMKWGQDIYAEDETANRLHNTDPRANQASQALNRAKFDLTMKQQHEQERAENQARTASESAARQKATDPRANQAAQALNRAKWDYNMNQKTSERSAPEEGTQRSNNDSREKLRQSILEEKARRLAQNGRAEGAGRPEDRPSSRPDYPTVSNDSKSNSASNNSQKSEESKYNGMSTREHLKNLSDNFENAFPGGFDNYVNQSLTTAIDIDNAYGNKNDADSLKNEFRQTLANSINEYLSENNIPETETSKFQALYDSYAGRYDDAVDAAMGIGAYQPVFGNRKNKYRQ